MTTYLTDANVWFALLVEEHEHHPATKRWFSGVLPDEAGLCRLVQLTLVRLLGTDRAMGGKALPASEAWALVQQLQEDERVVFLPEPRGLDAAVPALFRYRVPTPNLVNDAYLAAFALTARLRLITRDRGFLQFRGLDVEILPD